jgi:hypothetical protein
MAAGLLKSARSVETYQHTTQRRAETAQAFEPWCIGPRKRRDEARDLSRCRMVVLKCNAEASPGEAASKIAAPAGLAHRICSASVPQSQTGAGLSACAAG